MLHYRLHREATSSHQQIARLLEQLGPRLTLDVGAAQGFLGQLLEGSGLAMDAIEPRAEWAEAARPNYRRIFACGIEEAELPERAYDAIVCADVLEHLASPEAAIGKLMKAATDDAVFIISLPNVAHLAVRLMLLFGRFPRMERGILDRTHLHFYTRDTAQEMLREAGLRVEKVAATSVPLEEVWRGRKGWREAILAAMMGVQRVAVKVAPRLFAFQWIFVARKARGDKGEGEVATGKPNEAKAG